ncbi:MAG: hypothetical protein AAF802_09745 [Planctomycetota bacterium]
MIELPKRMSARGFNMNGIIAVKKSTALLVLSSMVLVATGCSVAQKTGESLFGKAMLEKLTPGPSKEDDGLKIGPTKVLTDATALALELPESDLQAREKFHQKFKSLVDAERYAAATVLVSRQPDYAYQILSSELSRGDSSLEDLAAAYDRFCGGTPNWQTLANHPSQQPIENYFAGRKQFLGAISNGRYAATEEVNLVELAEAAGSEALIVDAYYQHGIGALLRQDNATAADLFAASADHAADRHGMQAASAKLMCSESSRRAGDFARAIEEWQQSVQIACSQIRNRNLTDPNFWDQAAYLQPVGTAWPADIVPTFAGIGRGNACVIRTELLRQLSVIEEGTVLSGTVPPACWVESAVGSWRASRGESQKSLLSLKKAESLTDSKAAKDWLRIAQAPVLVQVGQNGAATSLLAPLIAREDNSPEMLAAMSKLGVIKLSTGASRHGVRLLHRAVIDSDGIDWPGKSTARADLALGMLMIGEDAEGMAQLEQAQLQFESEAELEQLAKSLTNHQKYLKHQEADKTRIAAITERLESLQL